jgi:glycosyltransferase involved in cell wall biosynthesis
MNHYDISEDKMRVVHWGVEDIPSPPVTQSPFQEKLVLFLGRVTLQKGPDYFVKLAQRVSQFVPNVKFVLAGAGDMLPKIIQQVVDSGLSEKFIFTGFLEGEEVHRMYRMADLYVMPSVSEPFGLVALEAIRNGTPVLISKNSGVSEVISHCFKVDFWDIDEMTNKVVNFLLHPALAIEMRDNSLEESKKFNIVEPAKKCIDVYREVVAW